MRHLTPKGARGRAAVKRLGRSYKTGTFDKIVAKAGGGEKGRRIAGAVYWSKVRKHRRSA